MSAVFVLVAAGYGAAGFVGDTHQPHDRMAAVRYSAVRLVEERSELIVGFKHYQRGILQQRHVDLRGLRARHGVLRRRGPNTRVALQPGAHGGETVEVAFYGERSERCGERQGGIPGEEVASGIA